MNKAYIRDIAYYLPKNVVSNSDIIKDFPDWSEEKISLKIGINKRYVSSCDETAGDMAYNAAKILFDEHHIDRKEIDALLLCTQSPDYFLPTTACVLQSKLGLRTNILAFDYNLGCSGFVYGLGIAKSLIVSGIATNVLLLTAETYNKYIHPKDRGNRSLFSDAAAATIISTDGISEINETDFGTDGSGYLNLIVESGAHRKKYSGIEISPEDGVNKSPDYLYMNGPEIFNFTLEAVPALVNNLLNKGQMRLEDVDLFVFHQANKHMLKFIKKQIGTPDDKFYLCLENYGNTVSSTIPIALSNAISNESIKEGMRVMITGFGVGYSWGGVNLQF